VAAARCIRVACIRDGELAGGRGAARGQNSLEKGVLCTVENGFIGFVITIVFIIVIIFVLVVFFTFVIVIFIIIIVVVSVVTARHFVRFRPLYGVSYCHRLRHILCD
jgi:hypothetical protein